MKLLIWFPVFLLLNLIFIKREVVGKQINSFLENKGLVRRSKVLGLNREYEINWVADLNKKSIEFELTVETLGFVRLGIAQRDSPFEDFVVGTIFANGSSFISSRERKGNKEQNWILLDSSDNSTHTRFKIQRQFETCSEEDVAINGNTLTLNWGYGHEDKLTLKDSDLEEGLYGSVLVNLLDLKPQVSTKDDDFKTWEFTRTTKMSPDRHTSYWCTVHKGPILQEKHHIVKFTPENKDVLAKNHIHHFVIYKCNRPANSNLTTEEYFDPHVESDGWECYEHRHEVTPQCRTFIYVWAYGGQELVLPDHVGIPIGESPDEYYMLEIHYDNPELIPNLELTGGIKIHYTSNLRDDDAGVFMTGHDLYPSLVVPPASENFDIFGHCSSDCTWNKFPPEGISLFGVLPHSHLKGRIMHLHHFRGNQELQWVLEDKNYNFGFQETRLMSKERRVLPGDQLTMRCSYRNSEKGNNETGSIVGGFSTREEMCLGFVWYYPKIQLNDCVSAYKLDELLKFFGISKITGRRGLIQPVILEPDSMRNKTLSEVMDQVIEWTPEKRVELQERLRSGPHVTRCSSGQSVPKKQLPLTTYSKVDKPYEHIAACSK